MSVEHKCDKHNSSFVNIECSVCRGEGHKDCASCDGGNDFSLDCLGCIDGTVKCGTCNGSGEYLECEYCNEEIFGEDE